MNEIVKRQETLPCNINDLHKFILVGKEKLKAYRAKLNAIEKLNLAKAVKDQAYDETQDMASALLWAEAKMGDLLKPLADPTASRAGRRQLPEGITHKQSHYAQQLANNYIKINLILINC